MPQQLFSHDSYAIRPVDLIPDDFDEDSDSEIDARWVHYCEISHGLDTEDLMAVVGEAFSMSDVPATLREAPPDERGVNR
jgi:hypothetical protein